MNIWRAPGSVQYMVLDRSHVSQREVPAPRTLGRLSKDGGLRAGTWAEERKEGCKGHISRGKTEKKYNIEEKEDEISVQSS